MGTKRDFIREELLVDKFMEDETNICHLEETEDSGRSVLEFELNSDTNISIKNVDKKHTDMYFFQNSKAKSMFKRVDHIIFEHRPGDKWRVHLIEMKSTVGNGTWVEARGKFRASYLLAQAIAAMLDMEIEETIMYTTYEKVDLSYKDTTPSARHMRVGEPSIRPEDEWNGGKFGLNFGERYSFIHKPIQMKRNDKNVLVGREVVS